MAGNFLNSHIFFIDYFQFCVGSVEILSDSCQTHSENFRNVNVKTRNSTHIPDQQWRKSEIAINQNRQRLSGPAIFNYKLVKQSNKSQFRMQISYAIYEIIIE